MSNDPGTNAENERLRREAKRKAGDREREAENNRQAGDAAMSLAITAAIISVI